MFIKWLKMLPISHKHRKKCCSVEELFYKDEGLNWRREFKELSGIVFTYIFHFHISSELFYPVTELISVVVCDSVDFKCEVISLTV